MADIDRHRRHRSVISGDGRLALSIARIDPAKQDQTLKIENLSPTDSVDEINFGDLWQSWAILAIAVSRTVTMP
jgi:hypothetical protein